MFPSQCQPGKWSGCCWGDLGGKILANLGSAVTPRCWVGRPLIARSLCCPPTPQDPQGFRVTGLPVPAGVGTHLSSPGAASPSVDQDIYCSGWGWTWFRF